MPSDDEFRNLQEYVFALDRKIDGVGVMADALRRALEPLGVSKETFDQLHRDAASELAELRARRLPMAIQAAADAKLRDQLEDLPGKKQ